MADVTITYKGETLATMDATSSKVLDTQGQYCEDDITVAYVKPSGGTPAIAIVDTPDSHGGVEREITALNISDSTLETADQLAQGITGYNKNGLKLTGTALGGGEPVATILVETAITTTSGAVAVLNDNFSSWETNRVYFASIQGNTATGNYKGLSITIIKHAQGMYYGLLRTANLTAVINDSYLFDVSAGSIITIYESENAIYPDPIKFPIIRPDAQLVQRWSVDHLLVTDDGVTLPTTAPTAARADLVESQSLPDITIDTANYEYFVNQRAIAYPIYSSSEIGRGRFEYSISESCMEALSFDRNEFIALVDSEKNYANGAYTFVGSSQYRGVYFTSASGAMSVYTSATYGLYVVFSTPSITSSAIRLSTPTLGVRCQANIYDEPFWNITTDIRYQYIMEVWRVPRGTDRDMDGWTNTMQMERTLGCVLSPSHTLT